VKGCDLAALKLHYNEKKGITEKESLDKLLYLYTQAELAQNLMKLFFVYYLFLSHVRVLAHTEQTRSDFENFINGKVFDTRIQ